MDHQPTNQIKDTNDAGGGPENGVGEFRSVDIGMKHHYERDQNNRQHAQQKRRRPTFTGECLHTLGKHGPVADDRREPL